MFRKWEQIFCVARHQYVEWLLNGKQVVIFFILFFMMQNISTPLIKFSQDIGIPLQWAETFLSAVNSFFTIPILCLCFITLMSEFPKRNYEDTNIFFRTGRATWYYGQILFSFFAVLTYLGEIVSLFLLRIMPVAYPANGWSPLIKSYMESYLETGKKYGVLAVVQSEVFNHFAPAEAFFMTVLLLAGLLAEINFIMLLFNLLNRKSAGIVINILLVVLGVGMLYMKSDNLSYIPLGNVVLQCQNTPATRLTEWYEPIRYFLISDFALVVLGRIKVRKLCL